MATINTNQAEYITKSDLKEELQKTSEHLVQEITGSVVENVLSNIVIQVVRPLTERIDELEAAMVRGFGKVYEHLHAIESIMATKTDILRVLDKTPSLHQFDQLTLEVNNLKRENK